MPSVTRPPKVGQWTEPALRVLRERYLTRKDGEVVETPEEMCWRVAQSIAAGEARYGRSPAAVTEVATAFYEMMIDQYFMPNSPTLMNAGTDTFRDALAKGEEYDLINPHNGKVMARLSAREVFERIVRAAWRTGDPGMVFLDRINASPANPTPEIGQIEATNPCGEQPLLPNEACNLGSLNVSKFARRAENGEMTIDWDEME